MRVEVCGRHDRGPRGAMLRSAIDARWPRPPPAVATACARSPAAPALRAAGVAGSRRLLPARLPLPHDLDAAGVRALPRGLRGDGARGGVARDRDPRGPRAALRPEGRPRAGRARRRRGRAERLRLAAAVPVRDHPGRGARRPRRLREPRGLAAARADARARPRRPPRAGARAVAGRPLPVRPRALPVPELARHVVDDRGPRHLRGDRAHGLRPRPQRRLAHGRADGGARRTLPGRGPGDLRPRRVARRPGAVPVRRVLPEAALVRRRGGDAAAARAPALHADRARSSTGAR